MAIPTIGGGVGFNNVEELQDAHREKLKFYFDAAAGNMPVERFVAALAGSFAEWHARTLYEVLRRLHQYKAEAGKLAVIREVFGGK